jgi:hypothetical protein
MMKRDSFNKLRIILEIAPSQNTIATGASLTNIHPLVRSATLGMILDT